jgi:hypothetical protein
MSVATFDEVIAKLRSPTRNQKLSMKAIKVSAAAFISVLENELPAGRNKDFVINQARQAAILANAVVVEG